MRRRQILSVMGLMAAPLRLWGADRAPTPTQTEGPFYPVEPIPLRMSLIKDENSVLGNVLHLSGVVTDRGGQPLPKARVEFWQCDGNGRYDHPLQPEHEKFDPGFFGSGAQQTDPQGVYHFVTLYPVPYTGRPPHIHAKIHLDGEEKLTTQLYLKGSVEHQQRLALQIDPQTQNDGRLTAQFDFVV